MPRLQIAYFSPLPPARSGIADYSRELIPYLAKHADITLFTCRSHEIDTDLAKEFPIRLILDYPEERWQYDIPLYQMGNSSHHEAIYQMFLRYPGIVTLHDYSLHHFISDRSVGSNQFAGYVRELGYELGQQGVALARQIRVGERSHELFEHPLNKRLLDLSLGLIVHSRYVQNLALSRKNNLPITVIPQQMVVPVKKSCRNKLPWPNDAVIFASAGQVTVAKQIEFALRAFKQVRQAVPNAYYLITGEQTDEVDLANIIHSLGLSDCVWLTGHVNGGQEFVDWIYSADIIINLRYPTVGETSRTALCALATGRPLIVFDHGWYSELPDSVCIKITPLDKISLVAAMLEIAQNPNKRQQLGQAGLQYIEQTCHPAHVAEMYVNFIQQIINNYKSR